jgi:hypothetical protein
MPTSTQSEARDRVGSFFYPPNGVHIYKPPGVSKKMHLVMCCQQASWEDSDYTEHVGRMGTTPQVINV